MPIVYSSLLYAKTIPDLQAVASISQVNPVSGTKYTVLDTTLRVRLISIWCRTGNTTAGTTSNLQVHVTAGEPIEFEKANPTAATAYYAIWSDQMNLDAMVLDTSVPSKSRAFLLEDNSIKVEAEITWTVQPTPLECKVYYQVFAI